MPTTENARRAAKAKARPADALGAARPAARHRFTHGYSRFVHMMKYLLPAVAMLLVALVAVWPHLKTKDTGFRIGIPGLKARETGDPSMVNARYVGSDKNNQLFSITAAPSRLDAMRTVVEVTRLQLVAGPPPKKYCDASQLKI